MKILVQTLLLSQALVAPLEFSDALKLADKNEAGLEAGVKSTLVQSQDTALHAAMANCVALAPGKLPAFTIVLKLDASGHALQSWRNNDLPVVRCAERELRNGSYKTNGQDEFYTSFVVSFTP
ncbi:hypothetical protein [Thermomonas sp. HDW16]|uniref:hypothetical protein n=1 Tax=Thermomonas sp. HDW16 TaxID=2714945 RepID=UPI00140D905A|nr:hypothetical protein [Thermomonas sp. HDW16]QIL21090.1 hypothetical protein G7079_10325 [Thermomonas sp. HDW16]